MRRRRRRRGSATLKAWRQRFWMRYYPSLDPERAEPFVQILTVEGGSAKVHFLRHTRCSWTSRFLWEPSSRFHRRQQKQRYWSHNKALRVALFDTSLGGAPRGPRSGVTESRGSVAKVGVVEVEWSQESAETVASGESGKPKVMWSPADVEQQLEIGLYGKCAGQMYLS